MFFLLFSPPHDFGLEVVPETQSPVRRRRQRQGLKVKPEEADVFKKKKRFSETVWETAEILFIFFVEKNPLTWFRFQDRVTAGGGRGFRDRRGKSGILFLKDKSTVYYFGHKFFVKYLHVCPVPGEGVAAGRGGEDAADAETDLDKKLPVKKSASLPPPSEATTATKRATTATTTKGSNCCSNCSNKSSICSSSSNSSNKKTKGH